MTGNTSPSSVCTRRSDEFCNGRNLLVDVIRTSPITKQTDGGGAAVVGGREGVWRGGVALARVWYICADQPVDEVAGETVGEAAADKDFSLVDDPDTVINQVLNHPVVTPSDTDKEEETMDVGAAGGDQQVQFSEEEPVVMEMNDELLDTDEEMSLEDILMTTPVDVSLPSDGIEIKKIKMGKEIKIPEVNERTWFLNSLPKIPADNKGKAILVEKDPVKGNPAKEHYYLICADIDLLVKLRAQRSKFYLGEKQSQPK
ncbi:hypothetical protein F511_36291 [Dorcoceras hygrometricum]|uniref:Uncharacterized protein n=1 Tax=Dorcoceras hygrometricum TaxID=472368 RepID=A0A2Z7C887_9LAMI|nr:hypothetical protein F511_36291 [Dorcoceras hygrometricum]